MRKIYLLLLSLILLPYVAVAQDSDAGYTIDYAAETITIAEGFSLYAAESGGNATFTSTSGNNTTSLTEYIQSTEKKLYLQAPASEEGEQPDRREITIPARPQAPTLTSATIDYSEEKISFASDVTVSNLEYALSQSDPNWQDVPSGAALSEMEWDGSTEKTYYFRTGATDSSFASSATTTPITAPARPAAPNDLNLMDYTDVSVTYYVGEGVQCRLGNEGDWVTLGQNETDHTFNDLTPQTTYTIYARKPATESQFASAEASDEVTTKSSAAEPPAMTYEVTANSITLSYSAPWQYQTSDDEWISVKGSKEFTSLEAATEYTFTVRVAESETAEASKVGTVKVYTAHATPTVGEGYSINYGAETISVNSDYEVNTAEDFTGTAIQSGAFLSDYTGKTLYIRHTGTQDGAPASAAVELTIPARPAAPSGLSATEVTSIGGEDGKIAGVTAAMEYKATTDNTWTSCAGTEITGLAPGTYQVRLAATETAFAGEAASVTIEEVVEIQIDKSESSIELGSEGIILTATITGIEDENNAENWKWESSNKDIVEVNRLTPEAPTTRSADNPIESTARVTPVGEGTATITVTYTGTKYTATKKYDITVKVKEEEPAPDPKPDPTPLYYNIQFEDICEGVDASLSKSVVKAGNQVSVYIEVEEGYDAENLKVMCKQSLYGYWEEIEEGVQPGEYIIYNVYNDIYVKVEGVEKIEEDPTGMSDIESTKVYAQNGSLYVYTSQPQEVAIITMSGTVLKREQQEGLQSYSLPKGVYIICIGEERYKIAVR